MGVASSSGHYDLPQFLSIGDSVRCELAALPNNEGIDFVADDGSILLHVTLRNNRGFVLNSKSKNHIWGGQMGCQELGTRPTNHKTVLTFIYSAEAWEIMRDGVMLSSCDFPHRYANPVVSVQPSTGLIIERMSIMKA